jgi:uncharacterized damage-inducible protein DinB
MPPERGSSVNELLLEAFRHNVWATKQLLAFCRGLPDEQLTSPGTATYGSILQTFNHLIHSDAGYVPRLDGSERPTWVDSADSVGLDELEARVDETAQRWQRLLTEPVDAKRLLVLDRGAYEAELSVLVVQALHHGNAHREQICSILTGFGIEPPDIQAWAYAEATGHARERPTD